MRAEQLAPLYPEWRNFQELRRKLDPHGRFGSPPIDRLLGPVGSGALDRRIEVLAPTGTP